MKQLLVKEPYKDGKVFYLTGKPYRYLVKVRRVAVGEVFRLLCEGNISCNAEVEEVLPDSVKLVMGEEIKASSTQKRSRIVLYQALLKGKKMDSVFRKGVECGVGKVVPFRSAHCVVDFQERQRDAKMQRWERIVSEAAQQSGNLYPFKVDYKDSLESLLDQISGTVLVFHQKNRDSLSIHEALFNDFQAEAKDEISLFIGPEGGFSEEELELFKSRGYYSVWMGPTVMRAETASIAALSIVSLLLLERDRWSLV